MQIHLVSAAERRKYIKSQHSIKTINLKYQNRILEKKMTRVDLVHSKTISELEAIKKVVAELENLRNKTLAKTLCIHWANFSASV